MYETVADIAIVLYGYFPTCLGLIDPAIIPHNKSYENARSVPVGALPGGIAAVLRSRIYQQELTVDAALTGNRQLALQALLEDPLVRDVASAEAMLDDALEVHSEHLPGFLRSNVRATA